MARRLVSALNRRTVDFVLPSRASNLSSPPGIFVVPSPVKSGAALAGDLNEDSRACARFPCCSSVSCTCPRETKVSRDGLLWSHFTNSSGQILDVCCRPAAGLGQWRGYAAKTKKAKSRVEEESDSTEDVSSEAKEVAVKMMDNAVDVLSREHAKLRTGRASAGMLDHITVEAHGVRTPLSHIAAVTVSGLQTLNVLPYDASMVKEVEKAILNSPLGLNPQVDGVTLSVPLPRLTKEHCETMCKLAGKSGEAAKLTVRRARKEALDTAKRSGNLSKDENKRFEKEVDELTKKYVKIIDEACKNKEKEIV